MPVRVGAQTVIILLSIDEQTFGLPVAVVCDTLRVRRGAHGTGWRAHGATPDHPGDDRTMDIDGHRLPLVDPAPALGIGRCATSGARSRSVVVVQSGEHRLGVLVDAVGEIVEVPREAIEALPSAGPRQGAVWQVARLADRSIGLLDVDRLLPSRDHQRTIA